MNIENKVFPKSELMLSTDHELYQEAVNRGFNKSSNPYCQLFQVLFFEGGRLHFKANLPSNWEEITRYLKALMGSFAPKHEEKEAICAYLLSHLVDIDKYKAKGVI